MYRISYFKIRFDPICIKENVIYIYITYISESGEISNVELAARKFSARLVFADGIKFRFGLDFLTRHRELTITNLINLTTM